MEIERMLYSNEIQSSLTLYKLSNLISYFSIIKIYLNPLLPKNKYQFGSPAILLKTDYYELPYVQK